MGARAASHDHGMRFDAFPLSFAVVHQERAVPHRIAVVEDDPFVRRHLARLIDAHPELQLMGEAGGVSAGLALAAKGATDLGPPMSPSS